MWFALKMFGNQARLKDENGNLPIHIAASKPTHKILHIPTSFGRKKICDEVNQCVIEMLVNYFPESAKISNAQHSLPLHLAIYSGKCWENGISCLLQHFPDSLDIVDPNVQLYPFMLAASSESNTSKPLPAFTTSSATLDDSLNLVFRFLRENPMNVIGRELQSGCLLQHH